jgi:hypothetical protein
MPQGQWCVSGVTGIGSNPVEAPCNAGVNCQLRWLELRDL